MSAEHLLPAGTTTNEVGIVSTPVFYLPQCTEKIGKMVKVAAIIPPCPSPFPIFGEFVLVHGVEAPNEARRLSFRVLTIHQPEAFR
jgi:hypothetical protein